MEDVRDTSPEGETGWRMGDKPERMEDGGETQEVTNPSKEPGGETENVAYSQAEINKAEEEASVDRDKEEEKGKEMSIESVDKLIYSLNLPYKHTVQFDSAHNRYTVVFSLPTNSSPVAKTVVRLYVFVGDDSDEKGPKIHFSSEHGSVVYESSHLDTVQESLRRRLMDRIDRDFQQREAVLSSTFAARKNISIQPGVTFSGFSSENAHRGAVLSRRPNQRRMRKKKNTEEDSPKESLERTSGIVATNNNYNNNMTAGGGGSGGAARDLLVTEFEISRLRDCTNFLLPQEKQEQEDLSDRQQKDDGAVVDNPTDTAGAELKKSRPKAKAGRSDDKFRFQEPVETTLAQLLVNVFGAADEDDECMLAHAEVQNLCEATLMDSKIGLTKSDIRILLTTATENDEGNIEYRPFVANAPMIVGALRTRRKQFEIRQNGPYEPPVPWEEVTNLYIGEEIEETTRILMKYMDNDLHHISRYKMRNALLNSRRFTNHEVKILMQMIPQRSTDNEPLSDADAFIQVQKLIINFRIETLQNPLVETDIASIQCYVELMLTKVIGYTGIDKQISIWQCKRVLMYLEHVSLSYFHIHALLCILEPDMYGFVDTKYFIYEVSRYVPAFFNAKNIADCALLCAKEKADALAARELRELQEFQGKNGKGIEGAKETLAQEDAGGVSEEGVSEEDLEKALLQFFQLNDRFGKHHGFLDVKKFLELCTSNLRQNYGFTEPEVRGFIAHADVNQNGEIPMVEHTRDAVPMIQAFRRCKYLYEIVHHHVFEH